MSPVLSFFSSSLHSSPPLEAVSHCQVMGHDYATLRTLKKGPRELTPHTNNKQKENIERNSVCYTAKSEPTLHRYPHRITPGRGEHISPPPLLSSPDQRRRERVEGASLLVHKFDLVCDGNLTLVTVLSQEQPSIQSSRTHTRRSRIRSDH